MSTGERKSAHHYQLRRRQVRCENKPEPPHFGHFSSTLFVLRIDVLVCFILEYENETFAGRLSFFSFFFGLWRITPPLLPWIFFLSTPLTIIINHHLRLDTEAEMTWATSRVPTYRMYVYSADLAFPPTFLVLFLAEKKSEVSILIMTCRCSCYA